MHPLPHGKQRFESENIGLAVVNSRDMAMVSYVLTSAGFATCLFPVRSEVSVCVMESRDSIWRESDLSLSKTFLQYLCSWNRNHGVIIAD